MSAAELAAAFAEARGTACRAREVYEEHWKSNPCGEDCTRERFESWKERNDAARAAHRRAVLVAAYWREVVVDRLSADVCEAYAAALPRFVGRQAGEKTRAKLYAAVAERLKAAGHARNENGDALPEVYVCGWGAGQLTARADGVQVELFGRAPNVDRFLEFVGKTNAFTDAVPARYPLDLSKFESADEFADAFERTTAELERLRVEYNNKVSALRKRAAWGDCTPLYSLADRMRDEVVR